MCAGKSTGKGFEDVAIKFVKRNKSKTDVVVELNMMKYISSFDFENVVKMINYGETIEHDSMWIAEEKCIGTKGYLDKFPGGDAAAKTRKLEEIWKGLLNGV